MRSSWLIIGQWFLCEHSEPRNYCCILGQAGAAVQFFEYPTSAQSTGSPFQLEELVSYTIEQLWYFASEKIWNFLGGTGFQSDHVLTWLCRRQLFIDCLGQVPLHFAWCCPVLIIRGLLLTGLEDWYKTIFPPLFFSQFTILDMPFTSPLMIWPAYWLLKVSATL